MNPRNHDRRRAPHSATSRMVAMIAVCLLTAAGCGDSHGRQPVSGKVTLNGAPVDRGDISFSPLEGSGFGGGAIIKNGEYETPKDKGLPPGKYLVRISSSVMESQPTGELGFAPAPSAKPAKELIPAEYNSKSTKSVEVTAEGPNRFDFEIVKK